jgi:hypothetical protein
MPYYNQAGLELANASKIAFNADLLAEQLQLVYRLTKDIRKLAESLEND